MDLFDLTGHVALVTGGNNGIGRGLASGLLKAGAQVCIWGTNAERNHTVVDELSVIGPVDSAIVDIRDEDAICSAMTQLIRRHGRLDACFANAGVGAARKPLLDTTLADFRAISAINLDGTFVTLREAAREMIEGGRGGSLVATSSMSVRQGQAGGYAYTASKGGLIAIVKALAVELARHDIRANALLPGWTESGMMQGALANERFVRNVLPRMPMRRWGTGSDFEAIAVYLASPASAFHTGDEILIDGGYLAF